MSRDELISVRRGLGRKKDCQCFVGLVVGRANLSHAERRPGRNILGVLQKADEGMKIRRLSVVGDGVCPPLGAVGDLLHHVAFPRISSKIMLNKTINDASEGTWRVQISITRSTDYDMALSSLPNKRIFKQQIKSRCSGYSDRVDKTNPSTNSTSS